MSTEKRQSGGYNIYLLGFARSQFRDFESDLRNVVGFDEVDIHLILKQ